MKDIKDIREIEKEYLKAHKKVVDTYTESIEIVVREILGYDFDSVDVISSTGERGRLSLEFNEYTNRPHLLFTPYLKDGSRLSNGRRKYIWIFDNESISQILTVYRRNE